MDLDMTRAAPTEPLPSPAGVGQPSHPGLETIAELCRAGHKSEAKDGLSFAQASAKGSKFPEMPPLCLELVCTA